ncbi:MAG: DUF1667 domain-containing protein [Eubacteriales bacterium]|nr:DUF1667 domain-containing protein [Eubacteriales bacterium]
MIREFTCIVCPNGCTVRAELEEERQGAAAGEQTIIKIGGAGCPRGEEYVRQELTDPKRNIATSVLVKGGELPLVSVRLTAPIPKRYIFDAMEQIKKVSLQAPVKSGAVVIENLLGLGVDVIATKNIA